MQSDVPQIEAVEVGDGTRLVVTWRNATFDGADLGKVVDLDGWIAMGGDVLAPLRDPSTFAKATVGGPGAFVTWDGDTGDLAIDSTHLALISREQQAFGSREAQAWQERLGLSNSEVAGFLDISTSTWATYKSGHAQIPHVVRMLCRSALRDPLSLHAWVHAARPPGRPRGRVASS